MNKAARGQLGMNCWVRETPASGRLPVMTLDSPNHAACLNRNDAVGQASRLFLTLMKPSFGEALSRPRIITKRCLNSLRMETGATPVLRAWPRTLGVFQLHRSGLTQRSSLKTAKNQQSSPRSSATSSVQSSACLAPLRLPLVVGSVAALPRCVMPEDRAQPQTIAPLPQSLFRSACSCSAGA